jgi:hypothetical protein
MIKTPISAICTDVKDDGGVHKYYDVGGDINIFEGGAWVPADKDVVPEVVVDAEKKTLNTKYKCGFAGSGWHLGIKTREVSPVQYLLKIKSVVGFDSIDDTMFDAGALIQNIRPGTALDDELNVTNAFDDADVQFIPCNSGTEVRNRFYSRITQTKAAKYYGMVWEVDNPAVIDLLTSDATMGCAFYQKGNLICEYFPEVAFHKTDSVSDQPIAEMVKYIDHNYTTVTTDLSDNTTWTTGTYHITTQDRYDTKRDSC